MQGRIVKLINGSKIVHINNNNRPNLVAKKKGNLRLSIQFRFVFNPKISLETICLIAIKQQDLEQFSWGW